MTPQQYEAAFLAQTSWRLALSNSPDEMVAIACTLRNHVYSKMGQVSKYKSYPEACLAFLESYPTRPFPDMPEDSFIAPGTVLALCEEIWDCSYPDVTATQTTLGATMFARVTTLESKDWRYPLVQSGQLLGTWGSQQFFRV